MAASAAERAARPSPQGRALESAGDRRPREMTVAPQGEQNPAYHSHRLFLVIVSVAKQSKQFFDFPTVF